jgi:hypothetical protein
VRHLVILPDAELEDRGSIVTGDFSEQLRELKTRFAFDPP